VHELGSGWAGAAPLDHHCSPFEAVLQRSPAFGTAGDLDRERGRTFADNRPRLRVQGLITDEGVGVGGAFDGDTANRMMPVARRVAGVRSFRRS
jgi:hypothetical protein